VADGLGTPVRRREDGHHLQGRGRFTDDVAATCPAGVLTMAVLRSPYAHARITSLDVSRARSAPGVIAVFTGADLLDAVEPLVPNWAVPGTAVPAHRALADGVARFHGEGVAAVLAEDAYAAADALEAIEVVYEPLPAVSDPWVAAQDGAPVVHPDLAGGNVAVRLPVQAGDYEGAQREADVTVRRRLRNQNLIPSALEPRAVLAEYDRATDEITVHTSTQAPHIIKRMLAGVLRLPEHRLRVVAPDVGGGFGSKLHLYPEEALVTALSLRLRRSVRWTATRSEDFLATNHGRDHVQDVEVCATAKGVITGIKARIYANVGAYLSGMAVGIPAVNCAFVLPGVYRIRNLDIETVVAFTNTSRVDTYRGAGRPEATYLIERMVDHLARELDLDPAEVRRRNFIPVEDFPYQPPVGLPYDSGNYEPNLDKALSLVDYPEQRRRQAEMRREGRYLGIGIATYTEFTGIGPGRVLNAIGFRYGGWEYGRVLVHPTGAVTVQTGSADQGQGHFTSYAQIAAEVLELGLEQIAVVEGDTGRVPFGLGTFNSRSMATGGSAVHECSRRILAKVRRIAARALGVDADEVDYAAGVFRGRDHGSLTWAEVAQLAHFVPTAYPRDLEPGLDEQVFYEPENLPFPFGTYVAVVEVDPETGDITFERMVAVDDCGTIVNPLLARGQVHGGIAQGLGQALLEGARYHEDGTLATTDWMTYAFPRASHVPHMETEHTITPSPLNAMGVKGVGEAGAIGAPPAIVNAVLDALAPLGITHLDMPVTAEQVRAAVRQSQEPSTATAGGRP
jgi:carbon-monoxide dehydrogenase large subunit